MNKKAIALLSGGLDSTIAVCLVKEQGVEVEAVNFQTMFNCCKDDARRVAYELGVPFTLLKVGDDYLKMVEKPKFGYGRGVNPCVDCRSYMFHMAKERMRETDASFMVSGEVLDQRPMSQKLKDFRRIEEETGLQGLILRPLSALKLPETEPEKAGIVDRSKFFGVHGRSRQLILELARKYKVTPPLSPSSGCSLTSPDFAKKVRDIFRHHADYERWQFELLKIGRHFRLDRRTKVVVARNQSQNEYLEYLHPKHTALLVSENFGGPHALLIGVKTPENLHRAAEIMLRYAQKPFPEPCEIRVEFEGQSEIFNVNHEIKEEELETLRIV